MRLYLATVHLPDLQWARTAGLLDGVVATPSVLAAEVPQADAREVLAEVAARIPLPIFASVGSLDAAEIHRQGKALTKLAEQVVVAVPLVDDALPALRRLAVDGVRTAATLVHSVAQGVLAARAGAGHAVIPVEALDAVGASALDIVGGLRAAFDRSGVECDLVVAGPSSAAQFGALAAAGADAAVLTPPTLRALLQHPLTDRGIDRFLGDVSRRAKPRRAR